MGDVVNVSKLRGTFVVVSFSDEPISGPCVCVRGARGLRTFVVDRVTVNRAATRARLRSQ